MLVLLDENVPQSLRLLIPGHDVRTVEHHGWKSLSNGALLDTAEKAGFQVLITADQNIPYQQNMDGRKIAILVLSSNERKILVTGISRIVGALEIVKPGNILAIDVG